MPRTVWNDEKDVELFLTILRIHDIKIDSAAVAAEMGTTAVAINHRIARIKLKAMKAGSEASDGSGNTPKSTNKNKAAGTTSGSASKASGAKRKKIDTDAMEGEKTDEDLVETPSKARRAPSARSSGKAKKSYKEEDDGPIESGGSPADSNDDELTGQVKREMSDDSVADHAQANRQLHTEAKLSDGYDF